VRPAAQSLTGTGSACPLGHTPGRQHVNCNRPEEIQHEGDSRRYANRIPEAPPIIPHAAPPSSFAIAVCGRARCRYSPWVTAGRGARRAKPRRRSAHAPEQPPTSKTTGTATTSQATPRNTITATARPIEVILSMSSSLIIASPIRSLDQTAPSTHGGGHVVLPVRFHGPLNDDMSPLIEHNNFPPSHDPDHAPWARSSAVPIVGAIHGTTSGTSVGGDSRAGRPSVSATWASARCVSSTVVSP